MASASRVSSPPNHQSTSKSSQHIELTLLSCSAFTFGLANGGTAGLIYMYIVVVIFFFMVNISMAEMASMAPTAGKSRSWLSL